MHRYTVERSWSVLSKMKKAGKFAQSSILRCSESHLLTQSGDVAFAGVKPSSRSYTPILQAFTTFRRAKQISVVLDDMDKEGVPKDGYIYSRILHALVNSFNLKKAFGVHTPPYFPSLLFVFDIPTHHKQKSFRNTKRLASLHGVTYTTSC